MINFDKFKSSEEAIERLLLDVKKFKVSLPDNFQPKTLLEVIYVSKIEYRVMEKAYAISSMISLTES